MFSFSENLVAFNEAEEGYIQATIDITEKSEGKTLNLDRLHLEFLPNYHGKLSEASDIQRLYLSYNNFSFLPPEIGQLTQLKELKLCSNLRIPFTLPSAIGNLHNLVNLKLSGNSLTSVPGEIGEITGMRMIDLSHNCLTELPSSFEKLENLLELRIDNNRLTKLPKLSSSLHFLSMSFNSHFSSLPQVLKLIENLGELNHLEMRSCEITEWPEFMLVLPRLRHLDFGCNRIAAIPDRCLTRCPSKDTLKKLYLDHNQLVEIPEDIGSCKNLLCLTLAGNDIHEVPLSFRHLAGLQEFTIDEENILIPPREVVQKGFKAIRSFIVSLAEESLPCYRVRLLVLGDKSSGKTSLLRRLRSGKSLKKTNSKGSAVMGPKEHHYIDKRVISMTSKQPDVSNITVEFNAWDFCGSGIETSHSFFVAPKSLFVITIDLREVNKENIRYWLQSISTRAGNAAPIFLIGTHSDDKSFRDDRLSSILTSIAEDFTSCFPGIRVITAVSSYDGSGFDALRDSLVKEALDQKHVGKIIPKPYALLEQSIQQVAVAKLEAQIPPLLSWEDYSQIGTTCHIHTGSTLRSATSYLRDLGVVITFSDETKENFHLKPTLVLDPEWICKMIDCVQGCGNKNGIVSHFEIDRVLKGTWFPSEHQQEYLELLRDYGIAFQGLTKTQEIIPFLLSPKLPNLQLIWLVNDNYRIQYERIWQFGYIPTGLFDRIISSLMIVTKYHSVWRHGCLVYLNGEWGLLNEHIQNGRISLAVRSSVAGAPFLQFITSLIGQVITNYYNKSEYQMQIPCVHCVGQRVPDPYSFLATDCESALLSSQTHLICKRGSGNNIPIGLSIIVPDLALNSTEIVKIDINQLHMETEILAEGAYGVLYRGIYHEQPVAVKMLRTEGSSAEEQISIFQEFRKEVSIMASVNHLNVVSLKGICYSGTEIGMIMELVDSGDLHGLIKDKSKLLTIPMCLKIAFDIAEGLHFLHKQSTPILHRDLKPGNVLLASSDTKWKYTAKLADFGLSTVQYIYKLKERAVETPIWLPPEILSGGSYRAPSDVFAFGIIFYEMVERRMPYDNFDFRFMNQLEEDIISGKRCDVSHTLETHPAIANLIEICWHNDPKQRPDFIQVMESLIILAKAYDNELYSYLKNRLRKLSHVVSKSQKHTGTLPLLDMRCFKKIHVETQEAITCMIAVGDDVWVAHKNCDISIWNAQDGTLFRNIIAAHPVEAISMVFGGSQVWVGTQNAMLGIWKSRHFPDHSSPSSAKMLKEGYLEPADGSPAMFVALKEGDKELGEHITLLGAKALPLNDKNRYGFTIQTEDSNIHRFFCANKDDAGKWITALNLAAESLDEVTESLQLGLIPHHRLLHIHSLVYDSGRLFVGTSDLTIRVYNSKNSLLIGEFPLVFESESSGDSSEDPTKVSKVEAAQLRKKNILQSPARFGERRIVPERSHLPQRPSAGSFIVSGSLKPRVQVKSIKLGKQRKMKPSKSMCNISEGFAKVDTNLRQSSSLMYGHYGSLWVVINCVILRCSMDDMTPLGLLEFHSQPIHALCGVDGTLWSCGDDKKLCVWDIEKMELLQVLQLDSVGYSLLRVGSLVWCGGEKDIYVWSMEDYSQIRVLTQHSDCVNSMILLWDRIVWSGSVDGSICIWN